MVCQITWKSSTCLDELFVSLPSEAVSALILSLWFIISLKLTAINWMTRLRNCWSPTLTDMNPKSYLNSLCALAKRAGNSEDNTCNLFAWGGLGEFCKFVAKYVITLKFHCYNFIITYICNENNGTVKCTFCGAQTQYSPLLDGVQIMTGHFPFSTMATHVPHVYSILLIWKQSIL